MHPLTHFWSRPQIWSNLIFLFPIVIAFYRGYIWAFVLLVPTFIASVIYHSFQNEVNTQWFFLRKVKRPEFIAGILDYIFSATVIVSFTIRFINSNPKPEIAGLFGFLVLVGFMIFMGPTYFPFLRRWSVTKTHSIWHIISGFITILILLTI